MKVVPLLFLSKKYIDRRNEVYYCIFVSIYRAVKIYRQQCGDGFLLFIIND